MRFIRIMHFRTCSICLGIYQKTENDGHEWWHTYNTLPSNWIPINIGYIVAIL